MNFLRKYKKIIIISIIAAVILVYICCMFVYPYCSGGYDWDYFIWVLGYWQTLNAAMIALFSSFIAFIMMLFKLNVERENLEKERERNFTASRAFLPNVFYDLTVYCEKCAKLQMVAFRKTQEVERLEKEMEELKKLDNNKEKFNKIQVVQKMLKKARAVKLDYGFVNLPDSYTEVFRRCIKYANQEVSLYLSELITKLQIHNARINDLVSNFHQDSGVIYLTTNFLDNIFYLGNIKVLINRQYKFARGMSDFNNSPIIWDEYINAYFLIDIPIEDIVDKEGCSLEKYTKKRLRNE